MQKAHKLVPEDQDGTPVVDGQEPGFQPGADGIFVDPKQHRGLIHRVTSMDFHAPRIEALQLLKPARTVAAYMLLPPENVISRVYAHQ